MCSSALRNGIHNNVLLIYPLTNEHLGLWKDLEHDSRVILLKSSLTAKGKIGHLANRFLRFFENMDIYFPLRHFFFSHRRIFSISRTCSQILVIDGALNTLSIYELERCRRENPSLKINLFFINSLKAKSPTMDRVRRVYDKFRWDDILSFDPVDAKEMGFRVMEFCYYSKHSINYHNPPSFDAYFVGGGKGNRSELIKKLYIYLESGGLKCDFNVMQSSDGHVEMPSGIHYFGGVWRPYEEILDGIASCNCIVEIVQEGQHGATLRYFEAVCYNKKLLTNNPCVVDYPYYNPDYIFYFADISDIDIDWIKRDIIVDFNYKGDFSPRLLIGNLLSGNN